MHTPPKLAKSRLKRGVHSHQHVDDEAWADSSCSRCRTPWRFVPGAWGFMPPHRSQRERHFDFCAGAGLVCGWSLSSLECLRMTAAGAVRVRSRSESRRESRSGSSRGLSFRFLRATRRGTSISRGGAHWAAEPLRWRVAGPRALTPPPVPRARNALSSSFERALKGRYGSARPLWWTS